MSRANIPRVEICRYTHMPTRNASINWQMDAWVTNKKATDLEWQLRRLRQS